jgi:hypothetical protein
MGNGISVTGKSADPSADENLELFWWTEGFGAGKGGEGVTAPDSVMRDSPPLPAPNPSVHQIHYLLDVFLNLISRQLPS